MSAAAAAVSRRAPWRSSILAALAVTLGHPASWAFGLAGFLAGGGIVVVAWPIVVLPTPTGLQNLLGAPVSTLVFGSPSAALTVLVVAAGIAVLVAVVLGTWIGAWAELQGIRSVLAAAADEGIVTPAEPGRRGAGPVAAVRLLSLVPVLAAAVLAWTPIYDAAYRELILPSELVTPLPLRVIREVPGPLALVIVTWLLSDAAAAVGVRRLVLDGRGPVAAWLLGWAGLARQPHRVLATAVIGLAALSLVVAPPLLAASLGWTRVQEVMVGGGEPVAVLVLVIAWVGVWLGGLVLAGVGAAFRAAAWTLGAARG